MSKLGKSFVVGLLEKPMLGTTRAGGYFTLVATSRGRLGVKPLSGGLHRIRVEPVSDEASSKLAPMFTSASDWKQPEASENMFRFSTVTVENAKTAEAILCATKALRKGVRNIAVSTEAPEHFQKLVASGSSSDAKRIAVFVATASLLAPSLEPKEDEAEDEETEDCGDTDQSDEVEESDDGVQDGAVTPSEEPAF